MCSARAVACCRPVRQDRVQSVFGAEKGVQLPILMYHSILKDSARQGNYVLSPDVLAADLDALQQRGYETVTVSDLLAFVQERCAAARKAGHDHL